MRGNTVAIPGGGRIEQRGPFATNRGLIARLPRCYHLEHRLVNRAVQPLSGIPPTRKVPYLPAYTNNWSCRLGHRRYVGKVPGADGGPVVIHPHYFEAAAEAMRCVKSQRCRPARAGLYSDKVGLGVSSARYTSGQFELYM